MNAPANAVFTFLFEYDLVVFAGTVLATGFVHQILSKWQTVRPFYTQDATLWNEFTGDTIHTAVLFIILYLLVMPLLYLSERLRLSKMQISKSRKHRSAMRVTLGMLSCTMVCILITELGKGYVGRLRPHFARACLHPKVPPFSANSEHLKQVFLSDDECLTTNPEAVHDARRSFPSGHTSLAMSGSAYAQLVFTNAARSPAATSEVVSVVFMGLGWASFLFAAWVSASRIVDNAHHVGDVAVGAALGLWCAAVHYWYVQGRNEAIEQSEARKAGEKTS